jgi:DNA gyrase/topoisomerase IV subunit B
LSETIRLCVELHGERLELAFQYRDSRESLFHLYVNSNRMIRPCGLLSGLTQAFGQALRSHARRQGMRRISTCNPSSWNAGLVATLSFWHPDPDCLEEWPGKWFDFRAAPAVVSMLHNELRTFWEARPDLAQRLIRRALCPPSERS